MYYVARMFEVEGSVLGREVQGFIALDDLYMHGTVYVDDILVGSRRRSPGTPGQLAEDGTLDAGHFMYGHNRLGSRF